MKLKTGASLVVMALALGFMIPASAQTTSPPGPSTAPRATEAPKAPVTGQILNQQADTVLAKEFIGQTVYAQDKTKIGAISDLILSKDAKTVDGFVLGVGGFLGIGEKSVALQMDRLKFAQDAESGGLRLTMDTTKDELANAPSFKSKKDQLAEERARNRPSEPTSPSQRPVAK